MDAGVAALLGALISGAVVLASQVVGASLSARHQQVQRRGLRFSRFMASTRGYVLAVGQVARAEPHEKSDLEGKLVWRYMDEVIDALAEIQLHEPESVTRSFEEVDALLGELIGIARERRFERKEWRETKDAILGDRMLALTATARRTVGR
jgi:hypothetical protein